MQRIARLAAVVGSLILFAGCGGSGSGGGSGGNGGGAGGGGSGGSGPDAVCGDGVREGREDCDGDSFGGQSCADFGPNGRGTLACSDDCDFVLGGCDFGAECGDGVAEGGEQCDGADLGGAGDCSDAGYDPGPLACTATCTYDFGACSGGTPDQCGDGARTGLEDCDGGTGGRDCQDIVGFSGGTLACDAATCAWDVSGCTPGFLCGNGVVEPGEGCDRVVPAALTCEGAGFDRGTVICAPTCAVDFSGCSNVTGDLPNLRALFSASCASAEDCADEWGRIYVSEAACLEDIDALIDLFVGFPGIDDSGIAGCADVLAGYACEELFAGAYLEDPACDLGSLFSGSPPAEVGEPCRGRGCVDGAFCEDDPQGGPECARCVPALGAGDPCRTSQCGEGLECIGGACIDPIDAPCLDDYDCGDDPYFCAVTGSCELRGVGSPCRAPADDDCGVTDLACVAGSCVAPRSVGEPCDSADDCASPYASGCIGRTCGLRGDRGDACLTTADCKGSLVCDRVCTNRPGLGDPCPDDLCLGPNTCIAGECGIEGPPVALAIGDTCGDPACYGEFTCADVYGTCAAGYCHDDGLTPTFECTVFPAPGEPCDDIEACDAATGYCTYDAIDMRPECAAYVPPGDPCSWDGECNDTVAHCDDVDAVCVLLGAAGDSCATSSDCVSNLNCYGYCDGGAYDGLPCDGYGCENGVCAGTCAYYDRAWQACAP